MKKRNVLLITVISIIGIQMWLLYITFTYPTPGVIVKQNASGQWEIKNFDTNSYAKKIGLKLGDVIVDVDGQNPNDFTSIKKWRSLDQAREITVIQNGHITRVTIKKTMDWNYDLLLPIFGGIICFSMAFLLFSKLSFSRSARLLSFLFTAIGFVFTSLGASIRGDVVGKILVVAGVMLIPILFLHFLSALFEEKGKIDFKVKHIRWMYYVVVSCFILELSYFSSTDLGYSFYQFMVIFSLVFFTIGFILNLTKMSVIYFKHRKEKSNISSIIKKVCISV